MSLDDEFCISNKEFATLLRLAGEWSTGEGVTFARTVIRRLRKEHPKAAESIAESLAAHGTSRAATRGVMVMPPVDADSRLELLRTENPRDIPTPIWGETQSAVFAQIVEEHRRCEELTAADLKPTTTALFSGPPGVGKTMSARWLASVLGIPLHTLDLSAVMSSFLGRTGNNIRNVLDFTRGTDCVLLLDEFDAIAKRRDDATEIGELKRLVTVLLQEIETWPSGGLLIAATNHAELLDPAVWRRFDSVVHFDLPQQPALITFMKRVLSGHKVSSEIIDIASVAFLGTSFSDVQREAERAKRESVITGKDVETLILGDLSHRMKGKTTKERKALAMRLVDSGMTPSDAHRLTGTSRDTIRSELKRKTG